MSTVAKGCLREWIFPAVELRCVFGHDEDAKSKEEDHDDTIDDTLYFVICGWLDATDALNDHPKHTPTIECGDREKIK